MSDETMVPFDFPKDSPHIIKVIGVGGGGGNAVNHMYNCLLYTSNAADEL